MKRIMTGLTVFMLLTPTMAIESIHVEKLSGSLNEGNQLGSFSFDTLSYADQSLKISSTQSQIETSLYEGIFTGSHHELELSYNFGAKSALAGIQDISTKDSSIQYEKNKHLYFSTSGVEIKHKGGAQYVPQMNLSCRNNQKSMVSEVAAICLSLAELNIPELQFDALSGKSVAKALNQKMKLDKIENVKLLVFDHQFQMQFKAKFIFNWTVHSNGTINFDENKKVLSIYLKKAKVGIISLKGKILDQIKAANLESVRVEGSMIYIQL